MTLTIILEDNKNKDVYGLANRIHDALAGNQDYVDSNIILNFDKGKDSQEVFVFFSKDDCCSDDLIKDKVNEIVNIFIES